MTPGAAQWLRVLSCCGEISPGDVDARDVQQVRAEDLVGRTKAHFFAGIGGWDYALRLAGWPAGRDVWTASLPCQPFSQAGQQRGTDDDRHLWPVFRDLVEQCRPTAIFGEQVASKPGRAWLASVQADLEALGYSTAAADLCAAGVGAPHIRQRLYWCAIRLGNPERELAGRDTGAGIETQGGACMRSECDSAGPSGATGGLADTERERARGRPEDEARPADQGPRPIGKLLPPTGADSWTGGLGDSAGPGPQGQQYRTSGATERQPARGTGGDGWADVVYLPCADGKARPIKPGLEPLVDGLPGRVGLLRGYGNAISPPLAAIFVQSVMEATQHG